MKIIGTLILAAGLAYGMGADTIQSLHVCKTEKSTILISVTDNETEGQALWIDQWENLIDNPLSIMIPIQTKNSFKTTSQVQSWVRQTFGTGSCVKMTEEDVEIEMKRQAQEKLDSLKGM